MKFGIVLLPISLQSTLWSQRENPNNIRYFGKEGESPLPLFLFISIAYFLDPHSARRQLFNPDDYNYQAGTKERLFESPQEVTWDKGSSGLVFYTDAQYWASLKSDEERNCDDWDVDMSTYYKDGKPDLDGSHLMEMREQDNLKQGISKQKSVFKKRIPKTFIRNELALVKNSSLSTNTSARKKKFNASFLTFRGAMHIIIVVLGSCPLSYFIWGNSRKLDMGHMPKKRVLFGLQIG